ncbi:MAG: ImmA/IrrE family metallo-endopeptidase [Ignavibacteria bacterium]|jgi:hypothetical protein
MNWKNKSILRLIDETGEIDPVSAIRERARRLVIEAFEKGWEGPPYNPIDLAKLLNVEIIPNDSVNDARIVGFKKNQFKIEYNPFQNPNRINFSIAHEIGHTLFSDCDEEIRNRELNNNFDWELEFLCNVAASEILLPYASFSNEANNCDLTIESLIDISNKYKASLESVFLRFTEVVDKPCGVIIGAFKKENSIIVEYFKASRFLKLEIPKKFRIPSHSKVYESKRPGWTSRNIEEWDIFKGQKLTLYSIGLTPLKKDMTQRVGIFLVPNESNLTNQENKIILEFGDATKPRGEGKKIIVQIVNTYAGMGLGFGKSLSKNYPLVKKKLDEWKTNKTNFKLGNIQLIKIEDDLFICQMLAQKGLYPKPGEVPLKYSSLRKCLIKLSEEAIKLKASIHMPQIGAGQAKGDWNIIQGMIHDELISRNLEVNVYLLAGTIYSSKLKSNLTLFKEESTWQKEK